MRFLLILLSLFLVSCGEEEQAVAPAEEKEPELRLTATSFDQLNGWGEDNYKEIVPAMVRSCTRILKAPDDKVFGPLTETGSYKEWKTTCEKFAIVATLDTQSLQQFFEDNFTPYQVSSDDDPIGLFTGYYEASLNGSRTQSEEFNIPLYTRPDDLVMVQLGEFRDDLKGRRIAGRVLDGSLKPYESRTEIVAGDWPHNDHVLVWVDDAVDAFFLQIQGSGIVTLDDGGTMRVGYAGQNGHPYYAVGRELIKMKALTKENVSMQSIRAWLENNPDQADDIMNTNASYVFFHELDGDGPLGGEGVALTAERSLAIDRSLLPYGMPIWVDITPPIEGEPRINRLMMGQDTGGAIRGAVRGDVFWGHGKRAEHLAGHMKSQGRYWILLPKQRSNTASDNL